MKKWIVLFMLFVINSGILIVTGCKKNTDVTDPIVTLINYNGCKEFAARTANDSVIPVKQNDCIEYSYDGKDTLIIRHINAGFNCCPGTIFSEIEVAGNTVTITEKETEAGCYCLCLFDLDYEVRNIKPGLYNIIIIEPYTKEGDELLELTINLNLSSSGSFCVERDHYPW